MKRVLELRNHPGFTGWIPLSKSLSTTDPFRHLAQASKTILLILGIVGLAGPAFSTEFHSYYQEYPNPDFEVGSSVILLETDFSNAEGGPDWEGWTSQDMTANPESFWQVSTYNASNLGGPGNHAWWCGRTYAEDCGTGDFNGYGNNWDTELVWAHAGAVPDESFTVTVMANLNVDTQSGFDYLRLGYRGNSGFVAVESFTGSLLNYFLYTSFAVSPAEIGDELILVWRFESDGAVSDEDCGRPSLGAAQIDNIDIGIDDMFVSFEDNEGVTNEWAEHLGPGCGDFAGLWDQLPDRDASRDNSGCQVAFVDDGVVVPGTGGSAGLTWTYGPAGYVVNSTGGLCGPEKGIHVEIRSPLVPLDAVPYDPFDLHLSFDVYRHEPLAVESPGIFYYWRVRDLDAAGAPCGTWHSSPYYYGEPAYLRHHHDLTGFVGPDAANIQVALGLIDAGDVWGRTGTDATPAPYFDNVSLIACPGDDLVLEAEEPDLAQDAFPAQGFLDITNPGTNSIRIDAARNVAPPGEPGNIPQDALVCRALARRWGLMGPPELHYTIRANPLFDPYRGWPTTGSVYGDTVTGSADKWAFDLPDSYLMYPGDVLHYYITVSNGLGATATIPADLTRYGDFAPHQYPERFTMRGLPSLRSPTPGDQPSILFWNDFGGRGEESKWFLALENLGYELGQGYDLYSTNHPSSALGNGLGGRAGSAALEGYETILYSCGDLGVFTLSNGDFATDAGNDLAVLDAWIRTGNRNLLLTGSNLYFDLLHNSGPAGTAFVADWLGVDLADQDVRRPFPAIGTMPGVLTVPGNPLFANISEWSVGPGPTGDALIWINAIGTTGGATRCAEFTDPAGNPAAGACAAATTFERAEYAYRNVCLPYDLMDVVYPPAKQWMPIAARTRILEEVLTYFGNCGDPNSARGIPDISLCAAGRASPGVPVSVYTLPDAAGNALDQCCAQGGSIVDATIWLQVVDGNGDPIEHYPAEDLWLAYTGNGQVPCGPVAASADGPTDAEGMTTFSGPFAWGGQVDPAGPELLGIFINEQMLTSVAPFGIYYNGPDLNGDLAVDLADAALFSQDVFGTYSYRSDFNWDGAINLSDITLLQNGFGSRCPEVASSTRLPVSLRTRLGVFFDETASSSCAAGVNPSESVSAYLCLLEPVDETGILAWECNIDVFGNAILTGSSLRGQANDFDGSAGGFSVALGEPLPSSDVVVLADLELLYSGPGSAGIFLKPADEPPFLPALPTYVTGGGEHLPVWPMSGNFATAAAVINGGCPVPGIVVSPDTLDCIAAPDSTGSRNLVIADAGTIDEDIPTLFWRVAGPLPDWLDVEPASGTIEAVGDSCILQVTADAAGLVEGQHFSHDLLIESNAGFAPTVATNVRLYVHDASGVPDPASPRAFALHQCVPNPFNPGTKIAFELPRRDAVRLLIFDVAGRLVKTLIHGEVYEPGRHEAVWRGTDDAGRRAASGTYFYRLEAGNFHETRRMVLLK